MDSQIRPIDYAYEIFANYLNTENFPPHTKLPAERDLAQMWGLNRSTLRSAMDRLENQGKIYSIKGSGTYVAPLKYIRNIQNSYSTSQAMSQFEGKLTSAILKEEKILANKKIGRALKVRIGYDLVCISRLRYMEDLPIMIETSYLKAEDYQRMSSADFEKDSLYERLSEIGQEVIEGQETLEISQANKKEAKLLNIEESDYIFNQKGVSYGQDGTPIEYFEASIRGDLIAFESWLT